MATDVKSVKGRRRRQPLDLWLKGTRSADTGMAEKDPIPHPAPQAAQKERPLPLASSPSTTAPQGGGVE